MPKFAAPPIRTFFLGNPPQEKVGDAKNIPAYAWITYFQSITNALSIPEPPPTSTSPGIAGQTTFDTNFFYGCVAPNTWKRIPWVAF